MKFKKVGIFINLDEEIKEEDILVIDTEKVKVGNQPSEKNKKTVKTKKIL